MAESASHVELRLIKEKLESDIRHLEDMIIAHTKEDDLTHKYEREARDLAAEVVKNKLEEMNRFRQENIEDKSKLVPREIHDKLDERVKDLELANSNLAGRTWVAGAVVIIINILIAIAAVYYKAK